MSIDWRLKEVRTEPGDPYVMLGTVRLMYRLRTTLFVFIA